MHYSDSTDYYQAREQRERELAAAAASPLTAGLHLELARRYSNLVTRSALLPRTQFIDTARRRVRAE